MPKYTVQQGDTLSSIAAAHGLYWETIWHHPQNAVLSEKRDPNLLYPGDEVFIPEPKYREVLAATSQRHHIIVKVNVTELCLRLMADGKPLADQRCMIRSEAGLDDQTTDSQGCMVFNIKPNINAVELTLIETGQKCLLKVGWLDPIGKTSGIQGRLANLGFYNHYLDGRIGAKTQGALRRFQRAFNLGITGAPDIETGLKLIELHEKDQTWQQEEFCFLRTLPPKSFSIAPNQWNTIDLPSTPELILDSHMHINSGHCAPMPLLWEQLPLGIQLSRSTVDSAAYLMSFRAASTQKKPTDQVAEKAVKKNKAAFHRYEFFPLTIKRERLTPMVVMPMDMEFAHIDGFKGQRIYIKSDKRYTYMIGGYSIMTQPVAVDVPPDELDQLKQDPATGRYRYKGYQVHLKEGGPFYWYYDRKSVDDPDDRQAKWLDVNEYKMYEKWNDQMLCTQKAVLKHPWRLLPMFHYDPRRWQKTKPDSTPSYPRYWAEPFNNMATTSRPGLFIGFKMYTALGYQPLDPHLSTLKHYYARCADESVPIVCHCSPGGVFAVDRKLYWDLEKDPAKREDYERTFWFDRKKDYYYHYYVSPMAWENVLKRWPSLRLCLAHFGGNDADWKEWRKYVGSARAKTLEKRTHKWFDDPENGIWIKKIISLMARYDNFYTDISYHMLKQSRNELQYLLTEHPQAETIKERILFGTDWYMIQLGHYSYAKYVCEAKKNLDKISDAIGEDLWERFTLINPMRFYRLKEIAESFAEGMTAAMDKLDDDKHPDFEPDYDLVASGKEVIQKVRL